MTSGTLKLDCIQIQNLISCYFVHRGAHFVHLRARFVEEERKMF